MDKKTIIGVIVFFVVLTVVLILLIPVEERNKRIEKWDELGEAAETNAMAEFIIENEELYTEDIIRLYYENNDNLEFVYNYAFHKDDYATMTFTNEELNSTEIPALYMDDTRWAYEYITEQRIFQSGCVGVSLTMANLYLNHNNLVDPVSVMRTAAAMKATNMFDFVIVENTGDIAAQLGLNAEGVDCYENQQAGVDHNELISALDEEDTVILLSMMSEEFGNHMIVARGYNDTGYYINDPASPENTEKLWPFAEIEKDVVFYWKITK